MKSRRRIASPGCLPEAAERVLSSAVLIEDGRIPAVIEFRMVKVPLLRCLRLMYGTKSNTKALVLALLEEWKWGVEYTVFKLVNWRQIRADRRADEKADAEVEV